MQTSQTARLVHRLVRPQPMLPPRSPSDDPLEAYDAARELLRADRHVQVTPADRHGQGDATLETGDERAHQGTIDRVELQRLGVVDLPACQLLQELRRVLVRVDGNTPRNLRR